MKQGKPKYFNSQIEIIRFETEDVITTSGNGNIPVIDGPGITLPIDPFEP